MSHPFPKIALYLLIIAMACLAFGQQIRTTNVVGGPGGSPFSDTNYQLGARVLEVRVSAGRIVDSVQITYEFQDGRTATGARHGGTGGDLNTFRLESDEYITGISGRYGQQIDSLTIHTNKRSSPRYGRSNGDRDFRLDVPSDQQAIGFAGRAGTYVDAIGLLYVPITQILETSIYGGTGGNPFSDSTLPSGARITEVRVRAGKMIDGVRVVYMTSDGRRMDGQHHGGNGGKENIFRLDSDEYITGLSGRYGKNIDSLTIRTNKRSSPMYGGNGGKTDFSVSLPSGSMATGFTGRSGNLLDAVGLTYTQIRSNLYQDIIRRLPGRNR